jgi:hypothetical protein
MRHLLELIIKLTDKPTPLTMNEIDCITTCIEILEIDGLQKFELEMLADAWPDRDDLNFKAWLINSTTFQKC